MRLVEFFVVVGLLPVRPIPVPDPCPLPVLPSVPASPGSTRRPPRLDHPPPRYQRYYLLRICVDPRDRTINAAASLTLASQDRSGATRLFLVPSLVTDSVRISGKIARFTRQADTLVIIRPQASTATGRPGRRGVVTTVYYHGQPDSSAFSFALHGTLPAASTYGLPYSARGWWPAPGSTGAKADSADVIVTVPLSMSAVSNGRLVSRITGNEGITYHWATRHPIYPDVISLAIAGYREIRRDVATIHDTIPLVLYVFPEDSAKAAFDLGRLPEMLQFFVGTLGPYPFADEKYGVAEFTTESFREHQTVPSLGPKYLTGDRRNEWIIAHELAHQWFGNSLSVRSWSDVWLNEGLATYAAFLWIESANGRAAYDSLIARHTAHTYEQVLPVADSADVQGMFTGATFFKAALMLHGLRQMLGDTSFFEALRAYVADNAYGLVTVDDLRRAMERACGAPLGDVFRLWLESTGAPPAAQARSICH